jgi:hypothetical protein
MPTANRSRWMRDYMKEYRQGKLRGEMLKGHLHPGNPDRREQLKEAHRLDSFKWRLSQFLSPQYEILLGLEYGPHRGVFRDDSDEEEYTTYGYYGEEVCSNPRKVMYRFPELREDFRHICDIGGGEIFKVFLLEKYSKKFDQYTVCVVGVLDKAALLENLQTLPSQGGSKWEKVLNSVNIEAERGGWRKLDFSEKSYRWWEEFRTRCQPLKCTTRDGPRWNSSELHSCLEGWAMGYRRIGPGQRYEWPRAVNGEIRRVIRSAMLM